jgi:hypothetical protein
LREVWQSGYTEIGIKMTLAAYKDNAIPFFFKKQRRFFDDLYPDIGETGKTGILRQGDSLRFANIMVIRRVKR